MRIDKMQSITQLYAANTMPTHVNDKKPTQKDRINLSEQAMDSQLAYKLAKQTADIRNDKVQTIKESIQSGNYNIEAKEVSEKIVRQLDLRG